MSPDFKLCNKARPKQLKNAGVLAFLLCPVEKKKSCLLIIMLNLPERTVANLNNE